MLTLNDGRNELWQWDTGRKLSVDADCSQVHFSNKVFGRSIDVDVVDGVAIIPDILLQTDKALMAWAFVGTPENGYTKISRLFNVNKRNKPADYMFTPPDQTTLGEILDRIKDLENRPSGGKVETDPTFSMPGFPADAKAVGDALDLKADQELVDEVVETLAEHENVHDILQQQINDKAGKNEIPKALPNPSKLTIDGESYDGSVAVDFTSTIKGMIDEKIGTGQGGASGEYELIADFTLKEDVNSFSVDTDLSGNPFLLKKYLMAYVWNTPEEGATLPSYLYLSENNGTWGVNQPALYTSAFQPPVAGKMLGGFFEVELLPNKSVNAMAFANTGDNLLEPFYPAVGNANSLRAVRLAQSDNFAEFFEIGGRCNDGTVPAGSRIMLWGVRA